MKFGSHKYWSQLTNAARKHAALPITADRAAPVHLWERLPAIIVAAPVVALSVGALVSLTVLPFIGSLIAIIGAVTAVGMLISETKFHATAPDSVVVTVSAAVLESHLVARVAVLSIPILPVAIAVRSVAAVAVLITLVIAHLVSAPLEIIVGTHTILLRTVIRAVVSPVVQPALKVLVVLEVLVPLLVMAPAILVAILRLISNGELGGAEHRHGNEQRSGPYCRS